VSSVPEQKSDRGNPWFRLAGLFLGFSILVWLPVEDQTELTVLIFSAAICTWFAARLLRTPSESGKQLIFRHILVGLGAGLILAPVALLLMAIKSGIHGHGNPDFSVEQMKSVLARTFYYALSGTLISLGIGIWRLAKKQDSELEG
jgi:hypothetical protein